MYVITDESDVALCVSETLEHQKNGNPLVHNGTLAIAAILVGNEYADVSNVPADYADGKYCFDGENWTLIPQHKKSAPSDMEKIEAQVLYTALMTDTLIEEE